jgi:hypothetical protein
MTRREEQSWNDGRLAFSDGTAIDKCPRKSPGQRKQWRAGFEHERRLALAEKITPEQRAESAAVAAKLKAFASTL